MIHRHYNISPAQLERDVEQMARTERMNKRLAVVCIALCVLAILAILIVGAL